MPGSNMASKKRAPDATPHDADNRPLRINSWPNLPLWDHQHQALKAIQAYLKAYKARQTAGSALVRIPTGAGKTGIIACVAQGFSQIGCTLIVVPWRHLTRQSAKEVAERFWEKLGSAPRSPLKSAVVLRPSTAEGDLAGDTDAIFLCTFQALAALQSNERYRRAYRRLKERCDIVLVDEGHREPALKWSEAVRGLQRPTVLFSATPYRNDVRLFDIDRNHVFSLAVDEALSGRFIREVEVHEEAYGNAAEDFVDALFAYYEALRRSDLDGDPVPRVIVRCATDGAIRHVTSLIQQRNPSVIAVHERFDDETEDDETEEVAFQRQVPDPTENDAVFWVHQNKLIEGLDDPRFRIVAIFEPFNNARAFVQQVGRVVRNPQRKRHQKAYVFARRDLHLANLWARFINYERKVGAKDISADNVVQDLFILHDDIQYLLGDFRERFDPTAADCHLQLQFTKAANAFTIGDEFSVTELGADIVDEIGRRGYQLLASSQPDGETVVHVYAKLEASPVLQDRAFIEVSLGYAIARRQGNVLFFCDSTGLMPPLLWADVDRVEPEKLERLLAGAGAAISAVSLLNTDLGNYSVRRRTLAARSIADVAPGLTDHAFFCSTATGSARIDKDHWVRRYVGFSRGRIREQTGQRVTYAGWCEWVASVEKELRSRRRGGLDLFERFAVYVATPSNPTPVHILFDIDDIVEEYGVISEHSTRALVLDDRCWDIQNSRFTCVVNGAECHVSIKWNRKSKRFLIESEDLDRLAIHTASRDERQQTLTAYLNTHQAFRLILNDGSIYAHRVFYKARVPLWGRDSDEPIALRGILTPKAELASIESEKGGAGSATADGWARGSLFEYIDRKGATGLLAQERLTADLMVCDDLGPERADFIAIQENPRRVVLIHAKVNERPAPLSASAFHVVCSQAVKNLWMLNPNSDELPRDLRQWGRAWKAAEGEVADRVRRGQRQTAEEMWQRIQTLVRHPATTREVWIVVAQGLSARAFDDARTRRPLPPPHAIQLFYLLQSTWAAASSVGAQLRVFCAP
jgi:superfamily II DNA or RNA helicase